MAISAWTDSAKQLSGLLFGDPAQRDAALERELNQAKVQRELAETEKLGYENQGLSALGGPEFFKGPDGKLRDMTDIAGAMMRAGKMDAGNFGDMYQALSGMNLNDPSFAATIPNPEQFGRNAALAAGNLANENTAITTGWADSMATRDTNNAIRQRNAQPRSETEVLAAALGSLPLNERTELARMKQLPSEVAQYEYGVTTPAYREYEMQNKSKAPGFRMTTDANGNPVVEYGTDLGSSGLTSSTTNKLQEEVLQGQRTINNLDAAISKLKDEQEAYVKGDIGITTGGSIGSIIAPGGSDNPVLEQLNTALSIGRAIPGARQLIEGVGVDTPTVMRVRENRLEIINAARQAERKIANGTATGQYTKDDARQAANSVKLIELGSSNEEVLSQLRALRNIEQRGLNFNSLNLGTGIDLGTAAPSGVPQPGDRPTADFNTRQEAQDADARGLLTPGTLIKVQGRIVGEVE